MPHDPGHARRTGAPAIILRPAGRAEALPCLYYTANGGKIIQSPGMALGDVEKQWVVDLGLVLVSISPRVRPEDPHPGTGRGCLRGPGLGQ